MAVAAFAAGCMGSRFAAGGTGLVVRPEEAFDFFAFFMEFFLSSENLESDGAVHDRAGHAHHGLHGLIGREDGQAFD